MIIDEYDNQSNNNELDREQFIDQQPLSVKHKIAAVILVIFGVFILIMWVFQMKNNINAPFAYKGENQNQTNNILTSTENNDEALKTKDSDKDGLSDWDELYVYKTSPYLEDSDSDGIKDKQEINGNTDPNCPTGRDCKNLGVVNGDQSVVNQGVVQKDNSSLDNLSNPINNQVNQQATTSTNLNVGNTKPSSGGQPDIATLRQLLLENGMQKDVLDKISDKDLLDSYAETLGKQ